MCLPYTPRHKIAGKLPELSCRTANVMATETALCVNEMKIKEKDVEEASQTLTADISSRPDSCYGRGKGRRDYCLGSEIFI